MKNSIKVAAIAASVSLSIVACTKPELAPSSNQTWARGGAAIERSTSVMSDAELSAFRASFQQALISRYSAAKTLSNGPVPPCSDGAQVLAYVEALVANNRGADAAAFADACLAGGEHTAEHYLAAARGAHATLHYASALQSLASAASAASTADTSAIVAMEYANALRSDYQAPPYAQLATVLAAGFASAADQATVQKLFGANLMLTAAFEAEVLALADRLSDRAAALLIYRLGRVMIHNEFRYHDAFQIYRSARGVRMMNGFSASGLNTLGMHVHQGLMNHRNNDLGYAEGEQLMIASAPYQRKDVTLFNLGFGPYTRDQINTTVCASVFETDPQLDEWKDSFVAGTAAPQTLLTQLDVFRSSHPHKTNTEVFRGTLLEALGNEDGALGAYWEARQLCPYNSRAIAGTMGVMNRLQNDASLDRFVPVLAGTPPTELHSYVTNDAMLSTVQRSSVAFNLQFWWPYLGFLSGAGKGLYVTPTFQGLADTPEMKGQGYDDYRAPDDGRLFDDWEGYGGDTIAASFTTLQDYEWGVVVHEAAHQFHALATSEIKQCIAKRYNEAKARNVFSRGYSATNEQEYFAVGVQDFAYPLSTLPKDWMRDNDPNLLALVASVSASNGDMNKVSCADAPVVDAGAVDAGAVEDAGQTDAGMPVAPVTPNNDVLVGGSFGGGGACSASPRKTASASLLVAVVAAMTVRAQRRRRQTAFGNV